ncbi:MAG TPA: DUF4157 domain-containing protein [Candidatus Elarobacter sp.]|nr:DUF4157 domain-containing protein [Candidatus Elarobacter sp.]
MSGPARTAAQSVHDVVRSAQGRPLPPHTRGTMERRLGRFFGGACATPRTADRLALGAASDRAERAADAIATAPPERASEPSARGFDLSAVRVHSGPRASDSARALRAVAYSVGNDVVVDSGRCAPGTAFGERVLAHELAHVAQSSHSGDHGATVRRFTEFAADEQLGDVSMGWKHPAGVAISVADDGQMVTEDKGWNPGTNKRAWSTASMIAASNSALGSQGSRAVLRLKSGGQEITGKAPANGQSSKLEEIEPVRSDGGTFDLASDCGSACKQIMGSGGGKDVAVIKGAPQESSGTAGAVGGAFAGGIGLGAAGAGIGYAAGGSDPKKQLAGALIGGAIGLVVGAVAGGFAGSAIQKALSKNDQPEERLTARTYHARPSDPTKPQTSSAEEWTEEVFRKEWGAGLTRTELYAKYAALSDAEKDAFDRKYGINNYAVPRTGQGITISSDYDMPGYADPSHSAWNFHYAAAVMSSGQDYVTLESAAGWKPDDWIWFMYGPASKKQSFKEVQAATGTHGTKQSALVVEPE